MITIYGELYSTKNSKQIFKTKTGRPFIAKSNASKMSEKPLLIQLQANRSKWREMIAGKEYPLSVCFFIHRKTRRRWDWINIVQGISDLMQTAGWLPDDDAEHYTPVFIGYDVDPKNPRVDIFVK